MLCVNNYTQNYIDECRARVAAQVCAYQTLIAAARSATDAPLLGAIEAIGLGTKSMYDAAGFEEVARRRPARPVVRLRLLED